MIAKAIKGKGFRGALEYDLREQKGHLLDSNMAGDDPRSLAREFGAVRALRPNLTRAVLHTSISIRPDEKLSDEQWRQVARAYLEGMGFKDSQYVVTQHTDTEHPHYTFWRTGSPCKAKSFPTVTTISARRTSCDGWSRNMVCTP